MIKYNQVHKYLDIYRVLYLDFPLLQNLYVP